MEREIKFRAWDGNVVRNVIRIQWKDDEDYECGCVEAESIEEEHFSTVLIPLCETVLEQFTGHHDKNTVDGYHNDIVCHDSGELYIIMQCEINNAWWLSRIGDTLFISITNLYDMEIVGNIHQNPELLEVKQ